MQTKYFHSGVTVTVTIIVNGANVVSSFVMLLRLSWKIVVPTDSTTWRANSCGDQRRTSSGSGKKLSWIPLASTPMTLGWKTLSRNGDVQGDIEDVSVWVLGERTDPPIHTESEQPPGSRTQGACSSSWMESTPSIPSSGASR